MQFFTEYIQPLNHWLYNHPNWSSLITFIVAFGESLTIIGALVPGSVTMTILGILAGTGVIRLDFTLIGAILGAIAGDWASYLLGYYYSDRLALMWPFSRYPSWFLYGKDFFNKHGGKSVLIGRFVGPLRSIIPVIAGMVHMPQMRFFLANFFSAIGWALLYIMPGFLIGAASAELSPERATKLFIILLIFIAALWVLTLILKHLLIRFNQFLNKHLQQIWAWSQKHPYYSFLFKSLTPKDESNHYTTALLFCIFVAATLFFLFLTLFISRLTAFNKPVFLFLQSIHTVFFDGFFVITSNLIHSLTLACLSLFMSFILLYKKNYRALAFWIVLQLTALLLVFLCQHGIQNPYPQGARLPLGNSFPASNMTLATAQFFFIYLYLKDNPHQTKWGFFLSLLLALACFAQIYLGDQWLLDIMGSMTAGIALGSFYWLLYRKKEQESYLSSAMMFLIVGTVLSMAVLLTLKNYQHILKSHRPINQMYFYEDNFWWHQKTPILPIYRKNRVGKPAALFNVHYFGSLDNLERALKQAGWQKQDETLLKTVISRIAAPKKTVSEPLMAELYLLQKPALVMTYQKINSPLLVLKLWRSNYFIIPEEQVIWLGSAQYKLTNKQQKDPSFLSPLSPLTKALPQFNKKLLTLPLDPATMSVMHINPILLLIREFPLEVPD